MPNTAGRQVTASVEFAGEFTIVRETLKKTESQGAEIQNGSAIIGPSNNSETGCNDLTDTR